jgi:hypothetical protein
MAVQAELRNTPHPRALTLPVCPPPLLTCHYQSCTTQCGGLIEHASVNELERVSCGHYSASCQSRQCVTHMLMRQSCDSFRSCRQLLCWSVQTINCQLTATLTHATSHSNNKRGKHHQVIQKHAKHNKSMQRHAPNPQASSACIPLPQIPTRRPSVTFSHTPPEHLL